MRYEIDENNYITAVYFNCNSGKCAEYTGNIPDRYTSLEEWASNATIEAYYLVDGNLTYDSVRDQELQAKWAEELENRPEGTVTIIDNLESTSATDALSANQGKVLNEKINGIIESGSGNNWNYIKYADGTMIQTQRFTITRDIKTTSGAVYWGYIEGYTDFAIPFTRLDNIQATGENPYIFSIMSKGSTLTKPADGMYAFAAAAGTYDITVNILAIGRWK